MGPRPRPGAGGPSLVIVLETTSSRTGTRPVAVADAANPRLFEVGSAFGDASISANGRNLTWDDGACVESWSPAETLFICPVDIDGVFHSPSVDAAKGGLLSAVWLVADTGDARRLVARSRWLGADVVVTNAESPDWAIVQSDLVVWRSWSKTGLQINEFYVGTASCRME